MRDVEGACDRQRLCDLLCGGTVTNHDVDLVCLAGEVDLADRAAAAEALEAWPAHRSERCERTLPWFEMTSARGGCLPADDYNDCSIGRDGIGRDLALRRPWMYPGGSHDKERLRVDDRAVAGRRHSMPSGGGDETNAVSCDDPAVIRCGRRRGEHEGGKDGEPDAHQYLYAYRRRRSPASVKADADSWEEPEAFERPRSSQCY